MAHRATRWAPGRSYAASVRHEFGCKWRSEHVLAVGASDEVDTGHPGVLEAAHEALASCSVPHLHLGVDTGMVPRLADHSRMGEGVGLVDASGLEGVAEEDVGPTHDGPITVVPGSVLALERAARSSRVEPHIGNC